VRPARLAEDLFAGHGQVLGRAKDAHVATGENGVGPSASALPDRPLPLSAAAHARRSALLCGGLNLVHRGYHDDNRKYERTRRGPDTTTHR
jgi:hypothetical protein